MLARVKFHSVLTVISCSFQLKFGMFLDEFLCNMMLDRFIETQDFKSRKILHFNHQNRYFISCHVFHSGAAEVAYDQMLQETVCDLPLTHALIWKACHHRWKLGDIPPANPEPDFEYDDVRLLLPLNFISE